jgi:ABC-type maltose transport system permease subunit
VIFDIADTLKKLVEKYTMKYRIKHFVKYIALILVTVGTLSAMSFYMIKAILRGKIG